MPIKVKKKVVAKKPAGNLTVLKTEMVPIDNVVYFHKNPRIGNVEKVAESLKENGQFKPIVVNIGTHTGRKNEILAGNHTHKGAKLLKWPQIFVAWVDVDEVTANRIVLADNGASDGATYDDSVLTELLADIKDAGASLIGTTYDDDVFNRLVKTIEISEDPNSNVDRIEDAPEHLDGVADLSNGVIFESDLPYDMPPLLIDMIPDTVPEPLDVWAGHELDGKDVRSDYSQTWWLAVWHTGCRGINWKQSIACFYTEDFHFDPVFNDPAKNTKKILNLGIPYAMTPNYSVNPDWPVATWIWAAYRSFYCARYFQEAGIQVIPDIQYGADDLALDVTLIGIPENAGVVSAQIQNARGDKTKIRTFARLLKESEDRLHFKNIIIYGHTDADEVLDRAGLSANIVRVSNRTARRRNYLNSDSTINSVKVKKGRKKS